MTPRFAPLVALLTAIALIAAVPAAAQVRGERQVYVTVLDKDGTPVSGLTPDFFAIREDGRDRTVMSATQLTIPMHAALLIDTSFGAHIQIDTFRKALGDFAERLAGAEHHVAIYAVAERPTQIVPFTRDAVKLRAGIASLFARPDSRSYLLDGIDLAMRDMQPLEPARPAIIAFTTEAPEGSTKSAGTLIKQLIARSTMFHAIAFSSASGSTTATAVGRDPQNIGIPARSQQLGRVATVGEGGRERNRLLEQGTAVTAGSVYRINAITMLTTPLFRLASEFAYAYRVSFAHPSSDKPLKDLQVGVMAEGVTVRAIAAPGMAK